MTIVTARKHGDAADGAVGGRLSRFEGQRKITGAATYALEYPVENPAYAVLVQSTIASGRVVSVDTSAANAAPGVLMVLTPQDDLGLITASDWYGNRPDNQPYYPLSNTVSFNGQSIAAVIAESREQAAEAAKLVRVVYEESTAINGLDDPNAGLGKLMDNLNVSWGDAEAALAASAVRIEAEYRTPREYHVAMEPHGLTAQWDEDRLTLWEPSQWTHGMARSYAEWFGLPLENVRIVSPFIGGGFGSKAGALAYGAVAAAAAKSWAVPLNWPSPGPKISPVTADVPRRARRSPWAQPRTGFYRQSFITVPVRHPPTWTILSRPVLRHRSSTRWKISVPSIASCRLIP